MKNLSRFFMIVCALTLVLSGTAAAQNKTETGTVDLKILPPAVLQAFTAAYPKAVIKGTGKETENGVILYEVESVDGKTNRDLLYTADGKAVEIEESIFPDDLPAPVKQTLDKEYPAAKILKAEILTKDGAKLFEMVIQVKDKSAEVTIDPQGRIEKKPKEEVEAEEAEEKEEAEENEENEAPEQEEAKSAAVDLNILPSAVLQAFKTAYPDAVIKGVGKETENGVILYEVESVDGKTNRDLLYTADGKAVEIEMSIAPESLPAPVKQTLNKEYPGAQILKAEILTKDGVKAYEISLKFKGETKSVTIDSEGKIR